MFANPPQSLLPQGIAGIILFCCPLSFFPILGWVMSFVGSSLFICLWPKRTGQNNEAYCYHRMHTHFLRSSCHTRFRGACTTHESHRDAPACIPPSMPIGCCGQSVPVPVPVPVPVRPAYDWCFLCFSSGSLWIFRCRCFPFARLTTWSPIAHQQAQHAYTRSFKPPAHDLSYFVPNHRVVYSSPTVILPRANIDQGIKFDKILSILVRIGVDSPKEFPPAPSFKKNGLQIRMEFCVYRNDKGSGSPGAFSSQTGNRTGPVFCVRGN